MTGPTASGKLNRLIAQAEAGGLRVEVERNNPDDKLFEQYSVVIQMPRLDDPNALAAYYNARSLRLYAIRLGPGSARAFKISATEYTYTGHRSIKPKMLPYTVQSYAGDYARYNEER